jgi:hypothetical protein
MTDDNVRRGKAAIFCGCNSHPATVAPAGSNRDDRGGNEPVGALDGKGRDRRPREQAGRNMRERRAGLENVLPWEPTRHCHGEGRCQGPSTRSSDKRGPWSHRGNGDGMSVEEIAGNTGNPRGWGCPPQPDAREGQAGPSRAADRLVVPSKPGNAGGEKGPDFGNVLEAV